MAELLLAQKKKWQHNSAVCQFIEEIKAAENAFAPVRRVVRRRTEVVQFGTPKFVVKALGKCQIKLGEHVVMLSEFKTQVVRDLFFFILQHADGVTKEEIGAAFWPESTLDALRLRFKNSIYRLRRALGSEIISFDEDYYRFNRNIEYDYDVENMVQELAIARAASTPEEKIQHYKLAVGYYKGQFLPKLDYEWVVVQREQLHRQFITGITELITQLNETRQFQLAIHYADRAIEEDPCYEEAYRSAMISFSALGDRAGVSRQFEKCRATLKRELEIEPALQTRNLFTNLMQ
jgi:two-component SAPR family response regulator